MLPVKADLAICSVAAINWISVHAGFGKSSHTSLSTIVLIVGIGTKSYGFRKFCALKINFAISFIRKNQLECIVKVVMMLYLG